MSKAFKGKKAQTSYSLMEAPWQTAGRTQIQRTMEAPFKPYEGTRVAGYGEEGMFPLAQTELRRTLEGEYDPFTSPYYQATRRGMGRETEEAVRGVRRGAQLGGTLYGGGRVEAEGDVRMQMATELQRLLGGMAETERGRRFEAVPQAMGMAEAERGVEQAELNAAYQEFMRQQQYPLIMSKLAQMLMGYKPTYRAETTPGEASPFSQIAGAMPGATAGILSKILPF